jgi:hypothetical protein
MISGSKHLSIRLGSRVIGVRLPTASVPALGPTCLPLQWLPMALDSWANPNLTTDFRLGTSLMVPKSDTSTPSYVFTWRRT